MNTETTSQDGRPFSVVLDEPVKCCGGKLLIQYSGTFRCPCGKRQERAAKAQILSNAFKHGN